MKIGEEHIITPEDDMVEFGASWRYLSSRAWKSYGNRAVPLRWLKEDQHMVEFHDFLVALDRKKGDYTKVSKELQKYRFPLQWHSAANISSLRFKLEALLLTGATYEIIAKDLLGNRGGPELIELYAKLFFDIRNDDGSLETSNQRRMWLSLPVEGLVDEATERPLLWKFIATHLGYVGLVWLWCMPSPNGTVEDLRFKHDELMRMAQAKMLERFARGQVSNFDLNQFAMYTITRERIQFETGKGDTAETKVVQASMALLSRFAPKLAQAAKTVDEHKALTEAMHSRMEASQNVLKQQVPDAGVQAGFDKVNEMMNEKMQQNQGR